MRLMPWRWQFAGAVVLDSFIGLIIGRMLLSIKRAILELEH